MNKRKTIKYIGFYDYLRNNKQERVFALAATRKMDYITKVLVSLGYDVDIISISPSNSRGFGYIASKTENIDDHVRLLLAPSFKILTPIGKYARTLFAKYWLFFKMIRECRKGETILVYHTYAYAIPILLLKKIKSLNVVLEIEEYYSMVWHLPKCRQWKEKKILNSADDSSLVVSELLAGILNIKHPIISYGSYSVYEGPIERKRKDSIQLVYSGLIDRVKNSAFLAMESMLYLNGDYVLKISGPVGKETEKEFLLFIEKVNTQLGRQACEYCGVLNTEDYQQLLLSSDIALNPQQSGGYGTFLFPSKILTYLSYNLPVVTTRGESIVRSSLNDILYFCDDFTPQSIAETIQRVDLADRNDYRKILMEMDLQFKESLNNLFD